MALSILVSGKSFFVLTITVFNKFLFQYLQGTGNQTTVENLPSLADDKFINLRGGTDVRKANTATKWSTDWANY